jgi:hypothetical protein
LVPSVVPKKVVAQAKVNLLTAIHELKVAQMLFVLQPSLSMQFFGTADQEPPPWQKPEEPQILKWHEFRSFHCPTTSHS